MASSQPEYVEQLQLLQERYPQESAQKLLRFLRRHDGDVDQVRAYLFQREFRVKKLESLEARFGPALTVLQQECPSSQPLKRARLLKTMERFGGDVDHVRKYLQKIEAKQNGTNTNPNTSRQREEFRAKYSTQLVELEKAGINIKCPCVLKQLEKHQGDLNKVMEIMLRRQAKKDEISLLNTKYASQVAQLEADGIKIKNKRLMTQIMEKSNGLIDIAKQLLAERVRVKPLPDQSVSKKHCEMNADDIENIKRLRSAGVYGNPVKILGIFHECNESVEMTIARLEQQRQQREQHSEQQVQQRSSLLEIHDAYLTLNNRGDWPNDIQQVYLDGNNMMFVVDSLRRLCLNRAGKKTERAIADIAAAWNEQMRIPNVELIFDSTRQLDRIDSVQVSSAQPKYKTTDDMLIDIARRSENQEKNKRTIIVTSDRGLAIHLKHEGCQLVKSYAWFAHCVMVLAPDLIKQEELTDTTSTGKKTRYNLDELARRIAKIDL